MILLFMEISINEPSNSYGLFVVIFSQEILQLPRQRQQVHRIISQSRADGSPRHVFKTENEGPVERNGQHGLKEHTVGRVLVVLDKSTHSVCGINPWIMRIKGELVVKVFNPGMK